MQNLRVKLANKENVELSPSQVHLSNANHAAPLRDISNYSHAITSSEIYPQEKWKRLLRVNTGFAPRTEEQSGLKRPMIVTEDLRELQRKKL